jgi:hypothetical protein
MYDIPTGLSDFYRFLLSVEKCFVNSTIHYTFVPSALAKPLNNAQTGGAFYSK